jgi:hypothetical protein
MKNKRLKGAIVLLIAVLLCSACKGKAGAQTGSSGGGKSINSATELLEYLNSQPANGPDKPIKVAMKANDMMIGEIAFVIAAAGKYVSLDLSGSPLTKIPDGVFNNCKSLASIIIPNGVTSIGKSTFLYCTNLTSVTIPNSVTSIGEYAFRGSGLSSVTIPNSITSIGNDAFYDCSFTSITIPNSVTSIGEYAFCNDTLNSVTFQGKIASDNFGVYVRGDYGEGEGFVTPFFGDLRDKYLAGGIGTYIRTEVNEYGGGGTWTKQ